MAIRPVLGVIVGLGFAAVAPAWAADVPALGPSLPIFAQNPQPEKPSPWTGLYVGTEVFGIGGKGIKGGFGGGGYAGYQREFANNWVLGVEGGLGYVPSLSKYSAATGYEFGTASLKAGYDMGRFMPFVTAGAGLAKSNLRSLGYAGAFGTADDLFNGGGGGEAFGTVGAGVDYKITGNLTMELAVQAYKGPGLAAWP